MKRLEEMWDKKETNYIKQPLQFKKGNRDNLSSSDQNYLNLINTRCNHCKGIDNCMSKVYGSDGGVWEVNRYQQAYVIEYGGKTELQYDFCKLWYEKQGKGKIRGTYEIETPKIEYHNEQKRIAHTLFSKMRGYLFGNAGVGKTTMMKMLAQKFIDNGKDVILESTFNISNDIKKFENDTLEKYQNVDILIIDDLFRENVTSYKILDIYTPIIQYRVDNNKPLLITSNYNISQIKNIILQANVDETTAETLCSRIRMLGVYELKGKDYREVDNLLGDL